jgi:hypothetical protein
VFLRTASLKSSETKSGDEIPFYLFIKDNFLELEEEKNEIEQGPNP